MWFVLALVAALCQVLRNTVMKRLGHSLDEYINVWGRFTFLLPFAGAFVLWNGVPVIKPGFYLLNVNRAHIAWWAPLAVLFTDRGMRYTLLAALFFAPSVVTIKWAMQCSDQYMGTLGGYMAASLLITPIVLKTSRRHFVEIPKYWKAFVSFGLFASLTTVSQGTAYLMTLSSYVEAVKQVEILVAMAIGTVMFHEKQKVRDIAPGAAVMLAGVVLLSLAA